MGRLIRLTRIGVVAAAFTALTPAAASADVLVHAPSPVIDCGEDIEVGVWYQAYSGGPRWAEIAIKNSRGRTLAWKKVRATTEWRYWYYSPNCGRRYRVRYDTPGGPAVFKVRVRG